MHNRFGPLNSKNGYRRLNVAITRAKEKVICVASIRAEDMTPSESAKGAKMLQKYLEYAEKGQEVLSASHLLQAEIKESESPFEVDVENALILRGFLVDRQVGVSGFRIDLAIIDPKNQQTYVLGIECDGASYHSSYSARVNDRLRQEILEKLGWKIYRIWSQHWISHKEEIIDEIVSVIKL
jgi:very-short-patch-repair endonuclease